MIILIDNYDSFVYNLYQYLCILGKDVEVYRNDKITAQEIADKKPEAIVVSPGPCSPKEAGICVELVKKLHKDFPILGICLGHQVIGEAFGCDVVRAKKVMHGKTSMIKHDNKGIFKDIENPFEAMRYHSLIVSKDSVVPELEISAVSCDDGEIMGLRHKNYKVEGIQFHPESILTKVGMKLLENFLKQV
ncbi:aminodeoxychorismate/anthranilate synthase component II [bacterium]|nr:aminodeoxychorismate/anthranilate synthase component II [bacterium]